MVVLGGVVIISSNVKAQSCLVDGEVFGYNKVPVGRGLPVIIENKNKNIIRNVTTGYLYPPPLTQYDNDFNEALTCGEGDLIYVYAENGTYYGENQTIVNGTSQFFLNISLNKIISQVDVTSHPMSVFVRMNTTVNLTITVTNKQVGADTYNLTLEFNSDYALLNQTQIVNLLGGNTSQNVTLTIRDADSGVYSINVTAFSEGNPSINDTYEILLYVSHQPTQTNVRANTWNISTEDLEGLDVPEFHHFVNITTNGADQDGPQDSAKIVVCNNSMHPVNNTCPTGSQSLCEFMDAPVNASVAGQDLPCVYPTNDTVVVFYSWVCDRVYECSPPLIGFWCEQGCNLTVEIDVKNKTFDNSPSFKARATVNGIAPVESYCWFKTDHDPVDFEQINIMPMLEVTHTMPFQNWSYRPTNLGRYPFIQHYNYYNAIHNLTVKCNASGANDGINSTIFKIEHTQRDKVYYEDGDEINLYLALEKENLTLVVNFSQLDSKANATNYYVNNTLLDYNITFNISSINTRTDGQYNVTIDAYEQNGSRTMNGSIFVHLHNVWKRSDIDNAFDCWSFKQGYHFDEVACDWESDLNHVADKVDVFTVEISCFDSIDNDLDGQIDAADTDCPGQYYAIRRPAGIDSAFLGDPCYNNVCRVCIGGSDNNDDGLCDVGDTDGVNVRYLHKVQPGALFRAKFLKDGGLLGKPVRLSVNYFNDSLNISKNTSWIRQLQSIELGGCSGDDLCRSVTATTFNPPNPDQFAFTSLTEKVTTRFSGTAPDGNYSFVAVGKSVDGLSAFHNLVFLSVNATAIINESDNATYCFDFEDNDLNDYTDCLDASCDQVVRPLGTEKCEFAVELTCDDAFDNDGDGYADCQDDDCFQKNGTNGPCYAVEDFSPASCADSVNNDFDWGLYGQAAISRSYQSRVGGDIQLTDCLDVDCDTETGSAPLSARCEYAQEHTCADGFDNDADGRYDCTGNAYQTSYERDCDRWTNSLGGTPLYVCPRTESICDDDLDNDLDSDYPSGAIDPYLLFNTGSGGWDCKDIDCDGLKGDPLGDAVCEFGNETLCEDDFDNDGDGMVDCYDPLTCSNTSGTLFNLTGFCRPCTKWENITIDTCRDGLDTDFNGLVDCDDPDCYGLPGPGRTFCGLTETNCTNLVDDDFDTLVDEDDPDCTVPPVTPDETGPGQCSDAIDNDGDTDIDCADSDCASSMICVLGSYNNPCASIGFVGAIQVCRYRFVIRGHNETFRYTRNGLGAASVVLKAGNVNYSLRNISPKLNDQTSWMLGTTTGFVKVNDTYGLKAQADSGFAGNLNLELVSTVNETVTPGWYEIFVSTSIPGVYGLKTAPVYIGENEPPIVTGNVTEIGEEIVSGDKVEVRVIVNASDNGIFNSGIAWCEFNISGTRLNISDCIYSSTRSPGTYNYTVRAYDGALLTSDWGKIGFVVPNRPLQDGPFYDPYTGPNKTNYPDRSHFYPPNASDLVNVGVNFNGGAGFVDNATGCIVTIMNKTDVVSVQNLSLNATAVPGKAVCNGQLNLSMLDPLGGDNVTLGVYYFYVEVKDTNGVSAKTETQAIHLCKYKYYDKNGDYVCVDPCDELELINTPPVFILNISNQTWPQGTKLTTIDLDDHWFDPDYDFLTYNWTISNDRINVTVDPLTHFVTFDPQYTYNGIAYITFYASDSFSSTPSNIIMLDVTPVEIIVPKIPPAGGGGGGGGGQNQTPVCQENWVCTDWSICFPNGFQTRTCRDLAGCGTQMEKPETLKECQYVPTCRDRIKNQGEGGLDCGGPCPPCSSCADNIQNRDEQGLDCGGVFCKACPTCSDNIKNQGEEDVDCGGPCPSCSTCHDGIKNQGELNIDCGGPCVSCEVKVIARVINWHALLLAMSLAFFSSMMAVIVVLRLLRKRYLRVKAISLNYTMRLMRMFERKKLVKKELPILDWVNTHLDRIETELPNKTIKNLTNELDKLVRIFFKRIFFIRYAFTDEELVKEINKHKISKTVQKASSILFEELAQIKYGGEQLEKEDIKTLIQQIKVITERVVTEMEKRKKAKISISEKDISKIDQTLTGAKKLSLKGLFGKK
ncbi:hypothetical protein ACFL0V_01620 [Nanoarchaeota archaeon]